MRLWTSVRKTVPANTKSSAPGHGFASLLIYDGGSFIGYVEPQGDAFLIGQSSESIPWTLVLHVSLYMVEFVLALGLVISVIKLFKYTIGHGFQVKGKF